MKIAMLGTRGVPAAYSGFETCVESVGKRLADRGHRVFVYCRPKRTAGRHKLYRGMHLVTLPAVPTKSLETLSHTALSTVHAVARLRPDVAIVFGVGNAIFCRMLRLLGIPVAINVDGADWKRKKWGPLGSRYLRWSESVAMRHANAVIADSESVGAYYAREYRTSTVFVPYGADIPEEIGLDALDRFQLQPRQYLLAVGRLVPENGIHHLITAYAALSPRLPLVIVGDAQYGDAYKRYLQRIAPPSVIFTGYQFGPAYHELSANAFAFLFAAEVGGTHPVLVEQLAHGNCILARWTESNAEVVGDAAILYRDPDIDLADRMTLLLEDSALVERTRGLARQRSQRYSWDRVASQYEDLARSLVERASAPPPVDAPTSTQPRTVGADRVRR